MQEKKQVFRLGKSLLLFFFAFFKLRITIHPDLPGYRTDRMFAPADLESDLQRI